VHWKPAIYTVDSIRVGPRPTVNLQACSSSNDLRCSPALQEQGVG